jgi:hypothetical protein
MVEEFKIVRRWISACAGMTEKSEWGGRYDEEGRNE